MPTINSKLKTNILKSFFQISSLQKSKKNFVTLVYPKDRVKINKQSKLLQQQYRQKSTLLQSVTKGVNYSLVVAISLSAGLASGSLLVNQFNKKHENPNEEIRSVELFTEFVPTKIIEYQESQYYNFPLSFHLYQFENCPYCSQIRAYLDNFGFTYSVTEVDSYSKEELTKFTKARKLPILVLEDRISKKKWHLANATAILSALESLRNEKHVNFSQILEKYLPILRENGTFNPNKYNVINSDLNSIEWRKWINNVAIPVFNLNSVDSLKNLFEKFDLISEKSCWKSRYNPIKYYMVYYYNVYKAYAKRPSVIKRLDEDDQQKSPWQLLDQVLTQWEDGLGKQKFISGLEYPNLADLSMYGNVKAYEGCTVFRESIAKYSKFKEWYERMNEEILKGHNRSEKKYFLNMIINLSESLNTNQKEIVLEEIRPKTDEIVPKSSADNEKIIFRVLSATYLIHIFAFAYAAYMNK